MTRAACELLPGDLVWYDGGCTWRVVTSEPDRYDSGGWVLYMEDERHGAASILLRRHKQYQLELVAEGHRLCPGCRHPASSHRSGTGHCRHHACRCQERVAP